MPNAIRLLISASALPLLALAACGQEPADQNIAIDNNSATAVDVETLPADESSATTSEDLIDGTIEVNNDAATANQANGF